MGSIYAGQPTCRILSGESSDLVGAEGDLPHQSKQWGYEHTDHQRRAQPRTAYSKRPHHRAAGQANRVHYSHCRVVTFSLEVPATPGAFWRLSAMTLGVWGCSKACSYAPATWTDRRKQQEHATIHIILSEILLHLVLLQLGRASGETNLIPPLT